MNTSIIKKLSQITKTAVYKHRREINISDNPVFIVSAANSSALEKYIRYCRPAVVNINACNRLLFDFTDSKLHLTADTIRYLDSQLTELDALYLSSYELAEFGIANIVSTAELCAYCLKLTDSPADIIEFLKFNGIKPVKENLELLEKLAGLNIYEKAAIIKFEISRTECY